MAVFFRKNRGLNVRFYVQNPQKAHPLRGTASFDVFCVKVSVGASAGREEEPKNEHLGVIFHAYGEKKNPCRIYTKFCTTGDILDVITDTNFGVDRLRGFNMARGPILGFSIGFCSRP